MTNCKNDQDKSDEVKHTGMSFWMADENNNPLKDKINSAPKGKSINISDDDIMNNKLKSDIISILIYFEERLSDVEEGSGEKQPMLKEIKSVLDRIRKLK
ncbi:hypothetical protein [Chryseobacterium sp. 18068]|uniref:hypothetical protein n=1 Tax=Chryseobacterium sp. 18068 TaxID=2681414 RepID=UPI0013599D0F|nr:hypothetical protein [Chryseobacterium sp. 18068]